MEWKGRTVPLQKCIKVLLPSTGSNKMFCFRDIVVQGMISSKTADVLLLPSETINEEEENQACESAGVNTDTKHLRPFEKTQARDVREENHTA